MGDISIPQTMMAWALKEPGSLAKVRKAIPVPGPAEVLIRVEAVAICGTDLEILNHGAPATVNGESPFEHELVIGHEYAGTVVRLGYGVDEFSLGDRVAVEVHNGCGRCERCRQGMYTSCLNYGRIGKGHRANGFTTDGAFAEYAVNHVNTVFRMPENVSWEEGALAVTGGTAMYAIDVLGGLIAGASVVVIGPGPIGLMAVACAKALGAEVILAGTRENRLEVGRAMGADHLVNVRSESAVEAVRDYLGGGADLVIECSGAATAVNEGLHMLKRGGKLCLAAFAHELVAFDARYLATNNIFLYGIRGEGRSAVRRALALIAQGKVSCSPLITHRMTLEQLPEALRFAQHRIEDAIKIIVTPEHGQGRLSSIYPDVGMISSAADS